MSSTVRRGRKFSQGSTSLSPTKRKVSKDTSLATTTPKPVSKAESLRAEILSRLEKLPAKHEKANESLKAVHSQGSRFISMAGSSGKMSQSTKTKMIALYDTAMRQSASEANALRKMLLDLQHLRDHNFEQRLRVQGKLPRGALMVLLARHAQSLPLWIGEVDGHPPPLVGAIPPADKSELLESGYFVAAYVDEIWILAEVVKQCPATINKSSSAGDCYEIKDIDVDAERPQTTLARKYLIPLPRYRTDPQRDGHALFPVGALVLALYPQTTCFYKGVVEKPPSTATDDYQVAFDDPTYSSGFSPPLGIPQRYVVAFHDVLNAAGHRGNKKQTPAKKKKGDRKRAVIEDNDDDEEENGNNKSQ